ncbi:MAG: hypothetical protein HN720_13610, partial [Nitrospinaceae bacterium]|nr:hypothetical protein [Nitrospinaceae bacterium]
MFDDFEQRDDYQDIEEQKKIHQQIIDERTLLVKQVIESKNDEGVKKENFYLTQEQIADFI